MTLGTQTDLTVIKTVKSTEEKPIIDYISIYSNAYQRTINRYLESNDMQELYKAVYYGVQFVVRADIERLQTNKELQLTFELIESIKNNVSKLTPCQLLRMFPVIKTYDGDRWQSKDYFHTMKALKIHGLNTPLGDKLEDVLWEYMNHTLMVFQVKLFSVASKLYSMQTGKSPFQEFCEQQGITTYTEVEDAQTGEKYVRNNDNGEIFPLKKPKPRYLKLVKGKR